MGLKGTVRPLDDYSNTYIGLHSTDPAVGGSGHYKYGEYKYLCSSDEILAKACFNSSSIDIFELFDLKKDPYELRNIYSTAAPEIKTALARKLRVWYPCQGAACP